MTTPILITYTALRAGGACAAGIRERFPALRAAGVVIPCDYSTLSVDLLTIAQVLGIVPALDAAYFARVDDPRLRLFAADCAERALLRKRDAGREPDPRSWAAVEVARRHARGEATADELAAACDAAWYAARAAAGDAARDAARADAGDAARAAARAARAAWGAARDAERKWQTARLIHYLEQTP